jgi:hypothetical protein
MSDDDRKIIANELKKAFDAVSPFIQKHTAIVCPLCKNVCCINKHGYYDEDDLIFIRILGIKIPSYIPDRGDIDPCRFLREDGCSLERWMRPFRCTWYFCEPLLESMTGDKARLYREFVNSLQRLISIRQKFLSYLRVYPYLTFFT